MSPTGSPSRFDMDSPRSRAACTCLPPWISITIVVCLSVVAILLPHFILPLLSTRQTNRLPDGVTYTTRNIIKPHYDVAMEYEGVELENGVRILLGSEPKMEQAAVILCVHVGSLSNPRELEGLAHFTEHMLFMGSRKYPGENDLDTFISKHGTFPNAHTYRAATCYFYDIDPDYLEKSLDILTDALQEPLVRKSLIEREIIAIDNEFRDSSGDDRVRQDRVDEVTSDLENAYSRFSSGNIESLQKAAERLNIDIRQAVMDFVTKYYSSNIMSALIFSRHSLPDLEQLAAKALSPLVNRQTVLPMWNTPYLKEHLGLFIKIVPIEDETRLKLIFPMPDFVKYYRSRPEVYLATLLGHEGIGSIYSYLRKKGRVTHMEASTKGDMVGNYHIDISFKLPPKEGVEHVDEIITAFFEYVAMLKKTGPQQWLFEELVQVHNNSFQYRRKDATTTTLVQLCRDLRDFPWRDVLAGYHVFDEFDAELIEHFTEYLDPARVRVFILSKSFENSTNLQEQYYKIDYSVDPIPEEKIKQWRAANGSSAFHLPERNNFIPNNFTMAPYEDFFTCIPKLVINQPSFHMWFMQDRSLNMPYAMVRLMFRHPVLVANVENVVGLEMLIRIFQYSIAEPFYNAHLSGFDVHVGRCSGGLCIYVDGFNQHIHTLIAELTKRIALFEVAAWRTAFVKVKKDYEAHLLMTIHERHMDIYKLPDFVNPYLQENYFPLPDLLAALSNCTVEKTQRILDVLKNDSTVEAFVYGNSVAADAKTIADLVMTAFKRGSLSFKDTPSARQAQLRRGVAYRQYKVNSQFPSNYLYLFFEVDRAGTSEDRLAALCTLFVKLIKEPLFNVIRTNEQLAYMLQAMDKGQQGSYGVAFYLVTGHDLSHLEERFAIFLRQYFKTFLEELSDTVFLEQKDAAMKQKLKKPQKMEDITSLYWQELIDQSYLHQRTSKEGAAMRDLNRSDIVEFHNKFFVQLETTTVYSLYLSSKPDESRVRWSSKDYTIKSVEAFRNDHGYHSFEKDHSVAHMSHPSG